MRISMHPELERGYNLFHKGKVNEALKTVNNFEDLGDLTQEDKHYYRILKGRIFLQRGKFQESFSIAEQDYQESKSQNRHLFLIDSIASKFFTLVLLGGRSADEVKEDVLLSEKLLKSITQDPSIEIELREGFLYLMKGYYFFWEQKLDKAIEQHKKSLALLENFPIFVSFFIPTNLHILGMSYEHKGELDLALDSHKRSLNLFQNMIKNPLAMGVSYNSIGVIYFQKGALDQAIQNFKKSLKIMERGTDGNSIFWSGKSYTSLIHAILYKTGPKEAQECLDHFLQYLGKKNLSIFGEKRSDWTRNPKNFHLYRLSKARLLASSSRVRDRAETENIAREILDEDPETGTYIATLQFLCWLYFQELKTSNNLEILNDIQPLIDKLIEESERINTASLRAQTYLLNGKLSLLRLNMGDARRYLTEAQQIADSHGLQRLANSISHEHDKLLDQLDGLENYKKKKMTLSERMDLASFDDTMDLIQRKREIRAPNLIEEEPVLLLIIGGGGILLFSYPFSEEVKVEDELFGGFLSAITTFSDEAFSQGLDRAKFGQYTVLMKNIDDYSFCYVLKGQTYLAQKKLNICTETFQKDSSMMQTLDKFNQTSQVIEFKDFPFLKGFIEGIFTNK
ncbi:MAG: tetratricopeptide repeat protein [Promethearchaeota archaeon]|jgi:tetratricopeptide (TPR) repeat protein